MTPSLAQWPELLCTAKAFLWQSTKATPVRPFEHAPLILHTIVGKAPIISRFRQSTRSSSGREHVASFEVPLLYSYLAGVGAYSILYAQEQANTRSQTPVILITVQSPVKRHSLLKLEGSKLCV